MKEAGLDSPLGNLSAPPVSSKPSFQSSTSALLFSADLTPWVNMWLGQSHEYGSVFSLYMTAGTQPIPIFTAGASIIGRNTILPYTVNLPRVSAIDLDLCPERMEGNCE